MANQKDRDLSELGDRVRTLRLERKLSQERLAEEASLDRTYISLVERGLRNPSFTNLQKMSRGLKTPISDLTKGL